MSDYLIVQNGILDYAIKLATDALKIYADPKGEEFKKAEPLNVRPLPHLNLLVAGIEPVEPDSNLDKTLLATLTLKEIYKIRSKL